MRRILGSVAVAMGVSASVAFGQTMLGHALLVLVLDQEYAAGNDTWPFQLVLLTWFAASAVVLGCAAARQIAGDVRWRSALAAAAGLAALTPIGLVRAWASGATSVADPALAATLAVLGGAVVGAVAGLAVLAWRGTGRSFTMWVAWVWLAILARVVTDDGGGLLHPSDPLGLPAVRWLWRDDFGVVLVALSPLALCALLGWWAKRRGDRFPVLGAVSGPLLLIAAHSVVFGLPGARIDGDHYSLPADLTVWIFVAVLGCGAAAAVVLAMTRWRTSQG